MASRRRAKPGSTHSKRDSAPPAFNRRDHQRRRWLAIVSGAVGLALLGLVIWSPWRQRVSTNLLLVTIDTLRADHVGTYGDTAAATPTIDALAARGVRFDQALTAVPLTGPSHATILTGEYPPVHGVRGNVTFTLGAAQPTLATLLKRRGYRTAAFVGAYPVAAAFGFGQGFDLFDEHFHESAEEQQGAERPANEVADAATAWLRSQGAVPFFAWVHFYDPHAPYVPPSPWRERFSGRPYDGEIAFVDEQIARIFDALRANGTADRTIVAVLADHGEALGEHGEATHGVLVYQSTMHVPFIVAGPGVPAGQAVAARVSTTDLLPTLLSLLGAEVPRSLVGRDLRPLFQGRRLTDTALYAESLFGRLSCRWASLRVWTKGDWKFIQGKEPELYNLASDPGELRDLAAAEPERVKDLASELQRAVNAMSPGGDRARANQVSAEQEARLRSLGYISASPGDAEIDDPTLPDPRTHVVYYDRLQAASQARGPALAAAFADVQEVTRLDPDNPFAHGTLATMAYRFGDLRVAARAFRRTLELDPDRPGVRQNYGKLLRELERLDESEQELRIAQGQSGADDTTTTISLAETLLAKGNTLEAGALIDGVLRRQPADKAALGAKGRLLLASGKAREALPYLEQATAAEPEPWIELADASLKAGDLGKALAAGSQAMERSPGHPWAMAVTAHALILDGERERGLELLKRAVAARPRRPAVWGSLADAFEAAGDRSSAQACRREAAALSHS
jgi:arylsulfatase A-like enzyme/Tfp pilus assembly protein PilF